MRAGPCSHKQNVGTKSCPVERVEYKIVLDKNIYTNSYCIRIISFKHQFVYLGFFPNNCIYILSTKLFLGYESYISTQRIIV